MATRKPYLTKTRQRVPSVTTILGKFKDPGPLMYWSWSLPYQQLEIACHLLSPENKADQRQIRQFLKTDPLEIGNYRGVATKAADAGTLAHLLVELWIHSKKGERLSLAKKTPITLTKTYNYPLEIAEKAHQSFQGFIEWAHQWKLDVVETECRLVSNEFSFGGTVDCIASIGTRGRKQLVLLDWKTSKGIYADYLCQVAAYGILWHEHYPDRPLDSYHLVRFDKETGDYHHHQWQNLVEAQQLFLKLRECYELLKTVEKRAK